MFRNHLSCPQSLSPEGFKQGTGIQTYFLDSRQQHAGMTSWDMSRFVLQSFTIQYPLAHRSPLPCLFRAFFRTC